MKKNLLFVVFGATILLTMNACKPEDELDKELKFNELTVEQQKAELEKSGLDFMTAMEGMQDSKAMMAILNMVEMTDSEEFAAPMKRLSNDIKNANKMAFTNFDQQMRASYVESEVWGEWVYNFETDEIEKIQEFSNKLIVRFPATNTATTNTGVITIVYKETAVVVAEPDVKHPSEITFEMLVDNKEVMAAKFSGIYHADGMPKKVTQTLTIDNYSWEAEINNDNKTLAESYVFKKDTAVLIKTLAEVSGSFTFDDMMTMVESEVSEIPVTKFAAQFQVMNVTVKGVVADFKNFIAEASAAPILIDADKGHTQSRADVLNKYFDCSAYFVAEKFADVEFYVSENSYTEYDYTSYPFQEISVTNYKIAPRFVLSDGSKVDADEYFSKGFDKIIERIENMEIDF